MESLSIKFDTDVNEREAWHATKQPSKRYGRQMHLASVCSLNTA